MSMMTDVSIATAYSEVYFDYFLFFQSFFRFSPFVCNKKIFFYFCVLVLTKYHKEPDALSNQKLPWDPAEIRVFKTRISA